MMKLNDVVDRIKGNVDRFTTDLEYYIGGEHFESNELEITQKGDLKASLGVLGFKFHFAFQPRDVVFMARNPHLRKAGMVNFSGLCSDASYILRSKDENVLSQDYLAVMLQSNHFWDYCDSHKVGSVNFANNWSSIANYEFDLPPIEYQRDLASKVWAAYRVKQSYKKLLAAIDEMVKSRFIEMFGDTNSASKGYPVKTFEELCEVITDGEHITPTRSDNGIFLLSARNIANGELLLDDVDFISEKEYQRIAKRVVPTTGDVLVSCSGSVGRVCVLPSNFRCQLVRSVALLRFKDDVLPFFMEKQIMSQDVQNQIDLLKSKTSQANIFQGNLKKLKGIVPPKSLQESYLAFVNQADKSGFELRKSIESIDAVIKSLINN